MAEAGLELTVLSPLPPVLESLVCSFHLASCICLYFIYF
jgi:hypothetical protein